MLIYGRLDAMCANDNNDPASLSWVSEAVGAGFLAELKWGASPIAAIGSGWTVTTALAATIVGRH